MALFLTILKIIGIILLILLGIVLVLLLLVLFVPVRYRAEGERTDGNTNADVHVTWLLHAVSFHLTYRDGEETPIQYSLRLFGISLKKLMDRFSGGGKKGNGHPDRKKSSKEKKLEKIRKEDPAAFERIVRKHEEEKAKAEKEKVHGKKDKNEESSGKKPSLRERLSAFRQRILTRIGMAAEAGTGLVLQILSFLFSVLVSLPFQIAEWGGKIVRKIIAFCGKMWMWIRFAADARTRSALMVVLRKGKKLVRHILPKQLAGDVVYGFDDPYRTGVLNAACSAFYPIYADSLSLVPDFTQKRLEGELSVKGRVQIYYLLWIFLSIFFHRDVRYVRKFLKEQKEVSQHGG